MGSTSKGQWALKCKQNVFLLLDLEEQQKSGRLVFTVS